MDKAPDAFRTISEVAQDLDLPQHVLRFWETRFAQIKPMKRGGGRRYYRPEDVDLLRGIKHLLYGEGYTIRGVQRILKDEGVRFVQSVWKTGAPQPSRSLADSEEADESVLAMHSVAGGAATEDEPVRGRGLFGILPSLLGSASDIVRPGAAAEQRAARIEPASEMEALPVQREADAADPRSNGPRDSLSSASPAALSASTLARDELHALRATLYELGECKRLLDAALLDDV